MKYLVKPTRTKEIAFCNGSCTCNGGNCNCKSTGGGKYKDTQIATVK